MHEASEESEEEEFQWEEEGEEEESEEEEEREPPQGVEFEIVSEERKLRRKLFRRVAERIWEQKLRPYQEWISLDRIVQEEYEKVAWEKRWQKEYTDYRLSYDLCVLCRNQDQKEKHSDVVFFLIFEEDTLLCEGCWKKKGDQYGWEDIVKETLYEKLFEYMRSEHPEHKRWCKKQMKG